MRIILVILAVAGLSLTSQAAQTGQAKPPAPAKPAAPAKPVAPAPIAAAFKTAYPNATILHVSKETAKGKTVYEVESTDAGRRRDLMYNPDGTVISFEEELSESDVPAAVMTALKARYPKASITRRERLVEGTNASIELGIKGAAVSEVVLTPDGKWITPKEKGK